VSIHLASVAASFIQAGDLCQVHVHSFLQNSPDTVINRVDVCEIQRHGVGGIKSGGSRTSSSVQLNNEMFVFLINSSAGQRPLYGAVIIRCSGLLQLLAVWRSW